MTTDPALRNSLPHENKVRTEAVQEFVSLAKGLFDLTCNEWEDSVWDVTTWCSNRSKTRRWRFFNDGESPFDPAFADVVKAVFVYQVRVNTVSPATLINWLVAIRSLYAVLSERKGLSSLTIWKDLTLRDFQQAEDKIAGKVNSGSRYQYAGRLRGFAKLLESRGIVFPTGYRPQQKRPRDTGIRHLEDRDAAMEKLPPMGALHALADAAQGPKNDWDRTLFSIVKLLVSLGFRIGEVLTLPADPWRVNDEGRNYLTYWPEKRGPLSPKWISAPAVELVRDAVETLQVLTEEVRQRARALEANPDRVPLPGDYDSDDVLGTRELAEALQMNDVRKFLRRFGVSPSIKGAGNNGNSWKWRVGDIEQSLAEAMPAHRYELILPNGSKQRLSESLCIMPDKRRYARYQTLMVKPIPATAVTNFLSSDKRGFSNSVFQRYGLIDENGNHWTISTHQLRHWLNTVAHKGGLPDFELARWMGRKDMRQNLSYQHLNQEERIERVKDAVRNKEMVGPMSEVYHHISAEDERELFLDGQVEAAHVTPYGTCTHNFATKPCPYNVQCLTGCGSFLRTKGDQREITYIGQIKRRAEHNIEAAAKTAVNGMPEAANWIEHQRRLLEGANRALAIEDDSEITTDDRVSVFPDAPDFGDVKDNKGS